MKIVGYLNSLPKNCNYLMLIVKVTFEIILALYLVLLFPC